MPVGLFEVSERYRKYGELKPCDSWVSFYLTYSSYVASDILQILTLNLYRRNVFSRISGYTLLQHQYFPVSLLIKHRPITSCLNTLHSAQRLVLHTATHVWPIHSSHFLDRKVITLPLLNFVVCESSSSLEKIFRGEYLTSFSSDPAATKLSSSSYTLAYYFCISLPKSCPVSVTYDITLHTIMYQISQGLMTHYVLISVYCTNAF